MSSQPENPYLSGNYAPVDDESTVHHLKVIGQIPKDLCGIYIASPEKFSSWPE